MAEVLSIVGLISFANELIKSICEIRKFCDDVKDAPKELTSFMDEIEVTGRQLEFLTHEFQGDFVLGDDNGILGLSLQRCHQAMTTMKSLLTDMHALMMSRRLLGSLKMLASKDKIAAMAQKLQQSRNEVQFAFIISERLRNRLQGRETQATMKLMLELLQQQARPFQGAEQPCITAETRDDTSNTVSTRAPVRKGQKSTKQNVQLRLPRWMCQDVWQICFERAAGRWNVCLTTFRTIHYAHEIWSAIAQDEVRSVKRLLNSGTILIRDQDDRGQEIFQRALQAGSISTARFLMQYGPDPGKLDNIYWRTHQSPHLSNDQSLDHPRAHAKLLLECCDEDEDLDPLIRVMAREPSMWNAAETLQTLNAFGVGSVRFPSHAVNLSPELLTATVNGCTFLHLLAESIAASDRSPATIAALDYVFRRSVSLHVTNSTQQTPFMTLVSNSAYASDAFRDQCMALWINQAHKAGVDLLAYGEKEQRLVQVLSRRYYGSYFSWMNLVSFSSGPNPSDWRLWHQEPSDGLAGLFWHYLEHPEERIPGAWTKEYLEESFCRDIDLRRGRKPLRYAGVERKMLRQLKKEVRQSQRAGQASYRIARIISLLEVVQENTQAYKRGPRTEGYLSTPSYHLTKRLGDLIVELDLDRSLPVGADGLWRGFE